MTRDYIAREDARPRPPEARPDPGSSWRVTGLSDAGSRSGRPEKRSTTPVGHATPARSRVRPAGDAPQAVPLASWPLSAPTANAGCLPHFANPAAAVLAALVASFSCRRKRDNPGPAPQFRQYPRKNPGRCDLLHISLVGPGLDRRHEQRDPNLIRRAGRPPHRLRPDRYRRWGGPGCAGLSPAGVKPSRTRPACVISRASQWVCAPADRVHGFQDFSLVRLRSSPGRESSAKIRQARRTL